MGDAYFLGVDIGTYSSKGVLAASDGRIAASHSVPHGMSMPHPGYFEHDADQVWWGDFVTITRSLLAKSGIDPHQVRAVGASAIGSCVLPINEKGQPLRPGILYGIDTRATAEIEELEAALGRAEIFQRSGMNLTSQASGPKVLWIRNHEPEIFDQARWFLTSQAYLVYKLTGTASIDVYTAGGYIPFYDVSRRSWDEQSAQLVTPVERLPRDTWSAEVVGKVTPAAAYETGLAEGTPVVAGTTDAAAEALSAGLANFGDMLLMFGSSIFFILKTHRLVQTQHFWSSNFLEEGTFAILGGMSTAGSLTKWFRDQLGQVELESEKASGRNAYELLAEMAASSPAGSNGLVALPYFEGERTPLHDPNARGVWLGLSLKHTRADLYRSILESVAYGIRHNFEVLAEEGLHPSRILVSGGGSLNPLWLKIVADVCAVDLVVPDQSAGASYGDAFLAAVGAGFFKDLSEIGQWVKPKQVVHSDEAAQRRYTLYYEIFRDLYLSTKPLMHRLATLTGE